MAVLGTLSKFQVKWSKTERVRKICGNCQRWGDQLVNKEGPDVRAFEAGIFDVSATIWRILGCQSLLLLAKPTKSGPKK